MPSPKWKLVVDIGEPEPPMNSMPTVSAAVAASNTVAQAPQEAVLNEKVSNDRENSNKDTRVDEVVSLLGEYMPSDPNSPMSSCLPGFMSLRLLLLRPSKTPEEEELVRIMLGSYSSYSSGGRTKSDIAHLLARDFMYLTQQHQQQQPQQHQQPFLGIGQSVTSQANSALSSGYSQFGMGPSAPSSAPSYQNSPALAPIPVPGIGLDCVSIVST